MGTRIAVVGAGPAGLAAAAAAANAGAEVLLFEERAAPGGQLLYRVQPIEAVEGAPAERPEQIGERLVEEVMRSGAELHTGALVAAAFSGNELLIVEGDEARKIKVDAVVVATGSTDLPYPFAGGTHPGVFSARALQILMNKWRVRPGKRFAIIGGGETAEELAIDILLAGGEVVWSGVAPAPFLRAAGSEGVRSLRVGPQEFAVDVIVIAVGRQADPALATMVEAPMAFAAALGGLVPVVDRQMKTSVPGLYVAGDAAGAGSVAMAIAEGRVAGLAVAASFGLASEAEVAAARAAGGEEIAWRGTERDALGTIFRQPFE